ncbi:MAG: RluA family pseudouridine synthase [Ruminiclostridium sp.]|nr:RluA family pseudouridine synthase [Ruminiclostridium sp.]
MRRLTLTITPEQAGKDVNTLLRRELRLSGSSVRRAKTFPDGILLDGQPVFTSAKANQGQILSVFVGDTVLSEQIEPVPGPLDILYEDEDLLVINKDGRTPVHPSQGHHGDTLANFLMAYYDTIGLRAAFHPVNRLDRGTSGLMAVAKHPHAHELLQQQLQDGRLTRTYLAVCEGVPELPAGVIDAPIGREPGSVLRRMVSPEGAQARTHYEVLRKENGRSLVRLRLETGRTHQIRVHMTHLGCPLVGDFLYGKETQELPDRFALHSASIRLYQPITGEEIALECPAPPELLNLLHQEERP